MFWSDFSTIGGKILVGWRSLTLMWGRLVGVENVRDVVAMLKNMIDNKLIRKCNSGFTKVTKAGEYNFVHVIYKNTEKLEINGK